MQAQLLPPFSKLGKQIESAFRKALFDYKMLENQKKIGIALSGGKDSLTALLMLNAINGKGFEPFELHAFHVSGAFSCGASIAENYLKDFCNSIDVSLHIRRTEQTKEKLECYSCAKARRIALFEMAKEQGISTIAFGHHRDDIAQTLLMNLFHKGEFCSMLPKMEMKKFNINIIRPLMYVDEEKIKSFAKQKGFLRITCQCPVGQNSYRKKTDQLIESIEHFYPQCTAKFTLLCA